MIKKKRLVALPLLIMFLLLSLLFYVFRNWQRDHHIDPVVVMAANALMFALASIAVMMHKRTIHNPNPNVFARSIMGATMIKLFIIAITALVWFVAARPGRNVNAIFFAMVLYVFYTILEVKIALELNKKKE
ncbi:MAG: hypothetical protein JWN76_2927 [Chitinophagaceae bacterium]|nr:hypothetical protein [Chitinophagaceae bacterium]